MLGYPTSAPSLGSMNEQAAAAAAQVLDASVSTLPLVSNLAMPQGPLFMPAEMDNLIAGSNNMSTAAFTEPYITDDFGMGMSSTLPDPATNSMNNNNINPELYFGNTQPVRGPGPANSFIPSTNTIQVTSSSLSLPGPAAHPPPHAHQTARDRPFRCNVAGCNKRFKRQFELTRHANTHRGATGIHLCPIFGCSKSYGSGYSRPDKVTEHLWKKHANLGYTKA